MSFSPEEKIKIREAAAAFEKQKEAWSKDKIEVFEQLLTLKAFTEWAKDNIIVNRDVDHINREVRILVIYKGEYGENKTSLQRLEEIRALVCAQGAAGDVKQNHSFDKLTMKEMISKILEIIDFDVTRATPLEDIVTEEEEEPNEKTN
jgi:hypothetical protein